MAASDTLSSILNSLSIGSLTTGEIVLSLVMTFAISLFIFYVYKKTYSGPIYSIEFNVTLLMIALIVTVIMLGISRNLVLSLGLVGALSIVRFRNAIKDSKDVAFLFWSITIGIVNGVQFFKLAIISSIFLGIIILVFSSRLRKFPKSYVLVLKYRGDINRSALDNIIEKNCRKYTLKNSMMTAEINEMVYEVSRKDDHLDFLKSLRRIKGVQSVNMFSHQGPLRD